MIALKKSSSVICLILALTTAVTGTCLNDIPAEAKQLHSLEAAKKAAKKQVPAAQITEAEMDTDNGTTVYDISLHKGSKEYNLKFRASDGTLLEYEWELPNTSYSIQNKKNLSQSAIQKKALRQVKNARVKSIVLRTDDGLQEYKVALTKGKRQYKLLYNAKNGALLEYEWKLVSSGSSSSSKITEKKARSIALAKVPGASIIKFELDNDDGRSVYEIELHKDVYEYEMKIDAKTGKILEFETDIDD